VDLQVVRGFVPSWMRAVSGEALSCPQALERLARHKYGISQATATFSSLDAWNYRWKLASDHELCLRMELAGNLQYVASYQRQR
jgi:hypothetical protein